MSKTNSPLNMGQENLTWPNVYGFVLAVPTKNKVSYLVLAKTMAAIFKEHGALAVV